MPTPARRARGRPRDPAVDDAIEDAAWAVLAELGPRRLSLERVAEQAGVAVSTVYRRFGSADDLLLALMDRVYADAPAPDTGTLRGDLRALMAGVVAAWTPLPQRRAMLVALIAAQEDNAVVARAYRRTLRRRRQVTAQIVTRAVDRGELPAGTDAELVLELLAGLAAQRLVVSRSPLTGSMAEAAVDLIVDGLRPVEH